MQAAEERGAGGEAEAEADEEEEAEGQVMGVSGKQWLVVNFQKVDSWNK